MGQGLAACVAAWGVKNPNVIVMRGAPTDNNATLFAQGYDGVLAPYFSSGKWTDVTNPAGHLDPPTALSEFQQQYTAHKNINAALIPNDENGAPIIHYLQGQGIKPKTFPTTGQDATLTGLQNILTGYQCGTVYKPIYLEAQAAAALALYVRAGQTPPSSLVNGQTADTPAKVAVPSVLLSPEWVTTANMNSTVIADKFVPAAQLCAGSYASRLQGRRHHRIIQEALRPFGVRASTARTPNGVIRQDVTVNDAEPLLRLRGIGKNFGPVHALTDINLDIPAGQVTALVGDNGAGKSTLIKTIAGIWQPNRGEILWQGKPVHFRSPKDATNAGIATVYQDLALADNLDIVQNMMLGHELLKAGLLDEIAMEKTAKKTLADLRVTTVRNIRQPVGSLSGGQRQAVAVAKAVQLDAKLVIMDEPTAALGVSQTALVLDIIEQLASRGIARAGDLAQPDRRVPRRRPDRRPLPRPHGVERAGGQLRHQLDGPLDDDRNGAERAVAATPQNTEG